MRWFLYNGQLGVATDDNGLYYMRSRYYNPEIKRFINQDVLIGSIGNSNSLNRYSYVEGNPVSYTDPFGLSPYKWISLGIHTALDVAGIWFPVADVANAFYYLFEGNPGEFGKSLILAIPGSDFLNIGTKFSAKLGKYSKLSEGIVKGVNAAGHIGSAAIMAYETGSAIGKMIDKYLVYDNELSKETAVEVGLIVLGCYGTAKYSDILAKYMGGLGGSVRPAKVTGDAGGTSVTDYLIKNREYTESGMRIASIKEVRNYKKTMNNQGIKVVVDVKGNKLPNGMAAGFNYKTGEIVIRKKPSMLSLQHESFHAKQWLDIGKEEYNKLTTLEKEEYVFKNLVDSKLLNEAELSHSEWYIKKVRNEVGGK